MELMYNNKKKRSVPLSSIHNMSVISFTESHNFNLYPKLFTKFIITYFTYSILNPNFSLVFSSTRWTLHQCPAICSHAPSKSKFTIFRLNQLPLITAFLRYFPLFSWHPLASKCCHFWPVLLSWPLPSNNARHQQFVLYGGSSFPLHWVGS